MLVKFQPLHVTPELSATRKLSKNGVVGARSEGRWELSGFPTLTPWRKGCRKKRSASRAESRRTASVENAGASPSAAGRQEWLCHEVMRKAKRRQFVCTALTGPACGGQACGNE